MDWRGRAQADGGPTGGSSTQVGSSAVVPEKESGTQTDPFTEALAREVVEASTDSKNHDRFEGAVRDAFELLGFEAQHLGGSGRTDVLLVAGLGGEGSYRVTVDAKTVGAGILVDQQVDWTTLVEHRRQHQADYSLLVGPRPASGRLMQRADTYKVAVLSANRLAELCSRHVRFPLGLADYRCLFAQLEGGQWVPRGGKVDTGHLDVAVAGISRMLNTATATVRLLSQWSLRLGSLTARDLWVMLEREGKAEGVSEAEVQGLLNMLAHPLVRALDGDPDEGYVLSSKLAVTRMRLERLGASVAAGSNS